MRLSIDLPDTLNMAIRSLWSHRLRSSLTMLGVLIGNASFVSMIAVGEGARSYLIQKLESFGPNRLIVYASSPSDSGFTEQRPTLVLDDVKAIAEGSPAIKAVAPQISTDLWYSRGTRTLKASTIGTTPGYLVVSNSAIQKGRFFLPSEQNSNELVVVLGAATAEKLFGPENPIDREISINNLTAKVIGVLKPKGSFARFNPDDAAYLPITTLATRIIGRNSPSGIPIDFLDVSAVDKDSIPAAAYQITNILLWRHKKRDFTIQTNKPFLDLILNVSTALTISLGVISGVSLLVGGIGVMNVMLVTVVERTHEIGLRKAIGATNRRIQNQFLIEAVILSATGGLIGVVIAMGGTAALATFSPLKPTVPPWAIVLSLGISGGVGLVFGVVPARNAAKLDPIIALRGS
jgi:putative ABC transport system permease protein